MNPEQRLEELNKTMAELQAEIAQAKADIAAAKAAPEPNIQDEAVNLDGGRGLQGNRDAEGSMITAKQIADANTMDKDLSQAQDYKAKVAKEGEETSEPEIQEFDADGYAIPLSDKVAIGVDDDLVTEKQMAVPEGFHEMPDGSIMADAEMEEPSKRTMGFELDKDGGFSSVNSKDDFWKTQEGYDKAMEMYGEKPSWVKEPTMIFNPETQEYEKIKEEDKEQFEDLGMSADIKRMFG